MSDRRAPGRQQLLLAALSIIGARGLKAATVRSVAEAAGVTPGLIVHHFGTKTRLLAEVEQLVLDRFETAFAVRDGSDTAAQAFTIAERLSGLIGGDAALRGYLRRAVLEGSPAGTAIVTRLVELTRAAVERFESDLGLLDDVDRTWLAVQIVTVNLAATLLEPTLAPALGHEPFSSAAVRERTAANLRFLAAAVGGLGQVTEAGHREALR